MHCFFIFVILLLLIIALIANFALLKCFAHKSPYLLFYLIMEMMKQVISKKVAQFLLNNFLSLWPAHQAANDAYRVTIQSIGADFFLIIFISDISYYLAKLPSFVVLSFLSFVLTMHVIIQLRFEVMDQAERILGLSPVLDIFFYSFFILFMNLVYTVLF